MANISFGSKYFIFSKFSSIPKTSKIETDRAKLKKEYQDFLEFQDSDELKDFIELGEYLESNEHKNLLNQLQEEKKAEENKRKSYLEQKKLKKFKDYFKFRESTKLKNYLEFEKSQDLAKYLELEREINSDEFKLAIDEAESALKTEQEKIAEFNKLKKSRPVKTYYKFRNSSKYKHFQEAESSAEVKKYLALVDSAEDKNGEEITRLKNSKNVTFYLKFKESPKLKEFLAFEGSKDLKKYNELKSYISSSEHTTNLENAKEKLGKLNNREKEYKQKKKSSAIRNHFKFQNSQKYKNYLAFSESKELAAYLELETYLNSEECKELIISLEGKLSLENKKIKEYSDFKNSKKYNWYLQLKDSDKFDELKKWNVVFEDDFSNGKLDENKWMTRYFWGDKLMKDAYALESDMAFPTDGKNIEPGNSTLKIITRSEKVEGKQWKLPFGFVPREFDYTTGLISTAKSHQQKYGKIEAKIKVNYAKPVNYNFWMVSESNMPHVDIMKLTGKKTKFDVGNISGDINDPSTAIKSKTQFSGLDVSQDFFIYTLIWTKDKLTWKVNDVVVHEQSQGLPDKKMYLVFSSAMTGKADSTGLPASMEIDWVRCYQEG